MIVLYFVVICDKFSQKKRTVEKQVREAIK